MSDEERLIIEGVAAQLYHRNRNGLGAWWSCLNESLKQKYRRDAEQALRYGTIAGWPAPSKPPSPQAHTASP